MIPAKTVSIKRQKKKHSELRISKKKHVENIQKEIQETDKKCDSKSCLRFANDNFLVF